MVDVRNHLARILRLSAITGALLVVLRAILRARAQPPVTGEASWLPLSDPVEAPKRPSPGSWVEPVDGVCPASHPVKGNAGSGIFHVPGGAFYDRTKPERCYASPAAAVADGMRAAKR